MPLVMQLINILLINKLIVRMSSDFDTFVYFLRALKLWFDPINELLDYNTWLVYNEVPSS